MIDTKLHSEFYHWLYLAMIKGWSSAWLEGNYADVYVRLFQGVVQIATVEVHDEYQRKGIFTEFLTHVESYNLPIYVENVINTDLDRFLANRPGYRVKMIGGVPSYDWKPTE